MVRTHIQIDGSIVVWGSLDTHLPAELKEYEAKYDWLTPSGRRRMNPT
ncbi:hypothetical protein [Streptomyces sp. 2131.1]|nr:hypothetical protein [Streptomyces sp. 2131.1]